MTQATAEACTREWSILTPRGLALFYIARHPGCTKRELGEALDVGARRMTSLVGELVSTGAVRASNGDGRRYHYEINPNACIDTTEGPMTLRAVLASLQV